MATRLAGRGENDLTTIQILCKNLFNKELPSQVEASNLFAMDRGYLSKSLIDYINSTGCSLVGTHKRSENYPFTFGKQQRIGKRMLLEEIGAKMTYWARKYDKKTKKSVSYPLFIAQDNATIVSIYEDIQKKIDARIQLVVSLDQ